MTSAPNTAVLPSGTMLDGITLREYIERSGKQPTETVINLFRPIFAAFLDTGIRQSPQKVVDSSRVAVEFPKEKVFGYLDSAHIRACLPDTIPEDQRVLVQRWSDRYGSKELEISYSEYVPYECIYVYYELDFQSLALQRSRINAYDDLFDDDDELTSLWSKALLETLVPLEDH